ncbi:gephyrin-like molybdotransferase Glp [Frisingicoccus sp.]|uniref:molybdopterin molybdotransferase MoeA n=1 Tax=Frisingicoccus sp. TaxID=1918627 RepID=UPI0015B7977B
MNIELLYTDTLTQAREKLKDETKNFELKVHRVACEEALGRICAKDVIAEENVPSFRRSTVDGYAILAGDSYGAGDSNPSFYQVTGCVNIEEQASMTVSTGEAVQVQTGSMIPDGATAVLMAEYTEQYADGKIIGYKAVSEDENIIQIGEDMAAGDCLIQRGREINARDIGMMAALGICDIEAYAPPAVTIISTGDELADIHEPLTGSKIRDINSYALAAEVRRAGMIVRRRFRVRDDEKEIFQAVSQSIKDSDIVLLSGGSSKGNKDYTKKVLEELTGNVFTHGIAIKPGKPTILAYDREYQTVIAGLPGHPMAAMLMFRLVILYWYSEKSGLQLRPPYMARISENVSSNQGRETCLPVKLVRSGDGFVAKPIHAKSGSIASLGRADGYVRIPRNQEGLNKGALVWVEVL